jgi:serine/threonine protein kinase
MSDAQHRLALPAGYELGRYRFQEILGSGGFGITYLAEDKTLNRKVAIKELLPNDIATRVDGTTVVAKTKAEEESLTWARERFVGEGRALAACDHPNVVNVYEMVEANGTAYMITKYEEGRSLEQWLRELGRRPNELELRGVLMPLLAGLETVHKAGFLHRDIKPENIYITKNGRPVLLDFGSARQAITNRSVAMTSIVTSGYAPFEQYHEDGNQGAWSDTYALAAVMYRAITGKKPPDATRRLKDDPIEKLTAHYGGQYDAEFLRAIDKALSVDESKRPQTIEDWRKMLGSGERLPLDSDATRLLPRVSRDPAWLAFIKANPAVIGGAAGGVLLLILVLSLIGHKGPKPPIGKVEPSPSGGQTSPGPQSSASPSGGSGNTANVSPGPAIVPGTSPSPQPPPAAAQIDPRLIGTWETKIAWPPEGAGNNPIGNWQDSSGIRTLLADGTATRKDTNGKSDDSTGHWKVVDGEIVVKDDNIQDGRDVGSTYQLKFSPDGKKLSGRWSVPEGVKATIPSGDVTWNRVTSKSARAQNVRWEQSADGHYAFSGPFSDAGVITAAGDGRFQQFSNAAKQPADVSYEFRGDKLVTNGPFGSAEWRRVGSAKRSSASRDQTVQPQREYKVRTRDIPHDIIKRAFRHFP